MTCSQLSESGVYVLGALAPAERLAFEHHMTSCAECSAEVNDLAVLPGLLGRLDESMVTGEVAPPPPTVLPGVLIEVRHQRRGHRIFAGVAAVALACVALVAGLTISHRGSTEVAKTHPSASAQVLVWHAMTPVKTGPVTANVALTSTDNGTRVHLHCTYAWPPGTSFSGGSVYALYAIPRNGGPAQSIATWTAGPGQTAWPTGDTALSPDQISRLELRNYSGDTLLIYTVRA